MKPSPGTGQAGAASHKQHQLKADSNVCLYAPDCFLLAWCAGLLSAFLSAEAAAAALLCLCGICLFRRMRPRGILAAAMGLVLGIGVWHLYVRQTVQPLCAMDGQSIRCTGTVTGISAAADGRPVYTLRTSLSGHRAAVDWYAPADSTLLRHGDCITLQAELTRISSDYRFHTAQTQAGHGKYLRIYRAEIVEITQKRGVSITHAIYEYRTAITERIRKMLPDDEGGLLCAMLFGDKSALDGETSDALYRTGIGHITAVSGLHLVFFCTAVTWILRRMRCSAKFIFLMHIPAVVLFILLADASVSVYRAALMLLLARSAPLFGRQTDALRSLALAMFLCTAAAPYIIGSASFWLSVSGVLGIGVLAPHLTRNIKSTNLREFLSLCTVSAAVTPASVLLFGESSLLSPVCNLIVLPLCTAALCLGFIVLLTGGMSAFLFVPAGILCRAVILLTKTLSLLPFSHFRLTEPFIRYTVAAAAIVLLLMLAAGKTPRAVTLTALACAIAVTFTAAAFAASANSKLQIAVLGSEKDAAAVISANGSNLILDLSGGRNNAQYVQRWLTDCGIESADLLLAAPDNAAAYQAELRGISILHVTVYSDALWRSEPRICGCTPLCTAEPVLLDTGNLTVNWYGDTTDIKWHGRVISLRPADSPACDAGYVIRWGGLPDAADNTPYVIVPAQTGSNFLFTLPQSGDAKIRFLS